MTMHTQPLAPPRHAPLGQLFAGDGMAAAVSISHNHDEVLLVVLEHAGEFFDRPLTCLTLESGRDRNLMRTAGYGMRIDANIVRFIADNQSPDVIQRRQFVRVAAAQRVILRSSDNKVLAVTLTVDLSGGGMLVKLPNSLVITGTVNFKLYLAGEHESSTISGVAQVARTRQDNQRGLVFSRIADVDRERLIHFIFDRQRQALAITRGDTG